MTLEEAILKIKSLTAGCSKFKIGKTGQRLPERFDDAYQDDYDLIKHICKSPKKLIIDKWEGSLISYFRENDHRCDNISRGGGEMTESGMYQIYIVIKV